jgi:protein TonB
MGTPKLSNPKMSTLKTPNPNLGSSFDPRLKVSPFKSSKLNLLAPKTGANANSFAESAEDPRQRGLMVGSLCLLLVALSIVLWRERDFWFPDTSDADAEIDQPVERTPTQPSAPAATSAISSNAAPASLLKHKSVRSAVSTKGNATAAAAVPPAPANATAPNSTPQNSGPVVARTVLPPLEVEVVAGDSHRVVRPGSDSVRVDLQPGTQMQPAPEAASSAENATAASVTRKAAERVQMSADTAAAVSSPVRPNYPLLARQMKVQGSVILQALIGRDGIIQNLRLVSGPRILAAAAEDAVRQWRFKPHYEGSEAVETQANITVNFTISTN